MQEEKTIKSKTPHNIILENRKKLSISGVLDVDSYDEQSIILFTDLGELTIRGKNLHINKLSIDTGELSVEGDITSLVYADVQAKPTSLLARMFK